MNGTCLTLKPWQLNELRRQPKVHRIQFINNSRVQPGVTAYVVCVCGCISVWVVRVLTDFVHCNFWPLKHGSPMKYASFSIYDSSQGTSTATDSGKHQRMGLIAGLANGEAWGCGWVERLVNCNHCLWFHLSGHKCHSIGADTNTQSLVRQLISVLPRCVPRSMANGRTHSCASCCVLLCPVPHPQIWQHLKWARDTSPTVSSVMAMTKRQAN